MPRRLEIYKCDICGNIVEVMHSGAGALVCCGQSMHLMRENSEDAAVEKHVPVVEKVEGGYRVKIGQKEHPMSEEHYIEWIELVVGDEVYTRFLNPGEKPEALFKADAGGAVVRAYCNLHGHWKIEQ